MKRPSIIRVRDSSDFDDDLNEVMDRDCSDGYGGEIFAGRIAQVGHVWPIMRKIRKVLTEGNNASVSQRYQE